MANKIFRKEVIIGACAILAVIVLIFGIDFLKGINLFKPANYYYVSYTDVSGLQVSAPVTINGFKVGQVREIEYEYDNPGHILVQLSLNKDLRVPRGTEAIIKQDLLGTATIHLQMPSHDDMHEIGERMIGVTEKGMLAGVGDKIMPTVDNILPKIDSLITSLNRIASSPELLASIKRLDGITANLEGTMRSINRSVDKLPTTMNGVNDAMINIDSITKNLVALSADLKDLPIKPMMDNFNVTSGNLRQLSADLNSPDSSLGMLLHDGSLYKNINNAVMSLDSLLNDIKANPKRYISIKLL